MAEMKPLLQQSLLIQQKQTAQNSELIALKKMLDTQVAQMAVQNPSKQPAIFLLKEVEAAGIEPPVYPETLEYTDATGRTTISELRDFDVAVTDAGLDDWQHLIRRVAPSRFVALWRVANRLRATAIEALVGGRGCQADRELERELAQSREETARLSRELEFRDAEIATLMARVAELEGAQQ
ncbi:uncharacterized protein LOC141646510 [Silene latifolia]|uniref:uncharacterized protein LOC141646510 n=1 Tax=Silene latifolia TaxID=37657 RepID=UPI003D7795E9